MFQFSKRVNKGFAVFGKAVDLLGKQFYFVLQLGLLLGDVFAAKLGLVAALGKLVGVVLRVLQLV